MKTLTTLLASLGLLLGPVNAMADTSALFIGNSFTFGYGSAVRYNRADTVTDLNNEGIGGVSALFKSFADQAGLDPRSLSENECSGYELGMSRNEIRMLQQAAFEQLASEGRVAANLLELPRPVAPERCFSAL